MSRKCQCSKDPCAKKVSGGRAHGSKPIVPMEGAWMGTDQQVGTCERPDKISL